MHLLSSLSFFYYRFCHLNIKRYHIKNFNISSFLLLYLFLFIITNFILLLFFSQFIFWKRIDNFIKHFLLRHIYTQNHKRQYVWVPGWTMRMLEKLYMKWYDFIGLFPSDINTLTQKRWRIPNTKKCFSSGEWKGI